jgi:hypothetical protein
VLFPHAKAALAQWPQDKDSLEEWALLLHKAAWYASERGTAGEAEYMSTVSMDVRQKMFGRGHPDTLASMSSWALVLQRQGKYEDAEAMNRQTLDITLSWGSITRTLVRVSRPMPRLEWTQQNTSIHLHSPAKLGIRSSKR